FAAERAREWIDPYDRHDRIQAPANHDADDVDLVGFRKGLSRGLLARRDRARARPGVISPAYARLLAPVGQERHRHFEAAAKHPAPLSTIASHHPNARR